MPRNGAGVLSLPGTYLAVSGETIEAQQHNDPLEDLEADANNARPIVAGGTGATSAADARTNLDVPSTSEVDFVAVPVAAILDFAGSTPPSGWLVCNGQAISRSTYSGLFTAIGTTYGSGDGSTTFNIPDCTGRVTAGKEATGTRLTFAASGVDGGALGATGGAQTHTLIEGELPALTKTTSTQAAQTLPWTNAAIAVGETTIEAAIRASGTTTSAVAHGHTVSFGSDDPHNNVQPTIVLNKIIFTGVAA